MTDISSKPRTIVAEFHMSLGKSLTLFQLTVIGEVTEHGRTWVARRIYDVDYSRRYGYLFHLSGGGGSDPVPVSGIYFASEGASVAESRCMLVGRKLKKVNRTRRLRRIPKAFDPTSGKDLLEWLERNAIQQDAVYCSQCRDFVPGDELCKHSWWCEKIGWYSTPGQRCGCKDRNLCNGEAAE